jgi:bacterioferritin-associated ferredoxin
MNHISPDPEKDIICYCSGTTKTKVKTLIDDGIDNLDGISRMTGACSGCGSCQTAVLEFLSQYG